MQKDNNLQDRFAEFGAQPTDQVWTNLEAELTRKKKRRAVLLWWTGLSFGALTILLVFMFLNTLYSTPSLTQGGTLDQRNQNDIESIHDSNEVAKEKEGKSFNESSITSEGEVSLSELKLKNSVNNHLEGGLTQEQRTVVKKDIFSTDELTAFKLETKIQGRTTKGVSSLSRVNDLQKLRGQEVDKNRKLLENSDVDEKEQLGLLKGDLNDNDSIMKSESSANVSVKGIDEKSLTNQLTKEKDSLISRNENDEIKDDVERVKSDSKIASKFSFGLHIGSAFGIEEELVISNPSWVTPIETTGYLEDASNVTQLSRINNPINIQFISAYDLFPRLSISSGLGYGQYRYVEKNDFELKYTKSLYAHSIEIPIQLNYKFLDTKKFSATAGLAYNNVILKRSTYTGIEYFGSVQFQFGASYHLNSNFSLQLQPFVKNYVVGKENQLKSRILMGAAFGVVFTPGKN